ncbi:MAG: SAM-dependent methyltransferase [Rubrimonas sp.]|uniref:SAM-dependent methyltransferase n=1 Tax=Rubrimonas sp. TaxID=2036015 RepID=UPI002FDEFEC9
MIDADLRPGEQTVAPPEGFDAQLWFIGRLRTPFADRADCPRQGDVATGPVCRVEIDPRWRLALTGVEECEEVVLLYWMHESRRDLVLQRPRGRDELVGTFALRSPVRPNPIAVSQVPLLGREGDALLVRGLDCVDGTPLLDVKLGLRPR